MSAKFEKNFAMNAATAILDQTRRMASVLVEREERRTGSRMAAYDVVASSIGASSAWLRDFIGRNPRVRPSLVTGLNIRAMYSQWCSRVEADLEHERALIAALRKQIEHETDLSDPGAVEGTKAAEKAATETG